MNLAPTGPHFLDTSAVIGMMGQRLTASSEARVPFVTSGGLLTGIERTNNPVREHARVQAAIGAVPVIYPTSRTVRIYARATAELQRFGQPIPTNDLWNAPLALEWNLMLLADDVHFARMANLKFVSVR